MQPGPGKNTDELVVSSFNLSVISGRAFLVAATKIWNALPDNVISTSSIDSFVILTFKAKRGIPDYFCSLLTGDQPMRTQRSSDTELLYRPCSSSYFESHECSSNYLELIVCYY